MLSLLRRSAKWTFYGIITFVSLVLTYLLAAMVFSAIEVHSAKNDTEPAGVDIYILSNGVHTDLVLPLKNDLVDWSKKVRFENTISKDSAMEYVAFGWGDKGFYLETPDWSDLKFSVAFKALFHLGNSAMHTTFYKQMEEGENCRKISMSRKCYEQLAAYVYSSFLESDGQDFIPIKENSYGRNDAFYEAKGTYDLFYTCNTWTNNGLKHCGQKACLWTPFDKGIFFHYPR